MSDPQRPRFTIFSTPPPRHHLLPPLTDHIPTVPTIPTIHASVTSSEMTEIQKKSLIMKALLGFGSCNTTPKSISTLCTISLSETLTLLKLLVVEGLVQETFEISRKGKKMSKYNICNSSDPFLLQSLNLICEDSIHVPSWRKWRKSGVGLKRLQREEEQNVSHTKRKVSNEEEEEEIPSLIPPSSDKDL